MRTVARYGSLFLVIAFFLLGGISHFTNTDMFIRIMPPWIPLKLEIVYITGVMEVVAALCLLVPKLRYWTGNFLLVFTLAVTPVNIYMWLYPERFPEIESPLLSVRLVLQVVLLAIIWFSTRREKAA